MSNPSVTDAVRIAIGQGLQKYDGLPYMSAACLASKIVRGLAPLLEAAEACAAACRKSDDRATSYDAEIYDAALAKLRGSDASP